MVRKPSKNVYYEHLIATNREKIFKNDFAVSLCTQNDCLDTKLKYSTRCSHSLRTHI